MISKLQKEIMNCLWWNLWTRGGVCK